MQGIETMVKVISTSIYHGDTEQPLEDEVNAWLSTHGKYEIQNIIFQQSMIPDNITPRGTAFIIYQPVE